MGGTVNKDQRTLFPFFNTEAFARPKDWTYGNAGKWTIRGPGSVDFSSFAFKNVRILENMPLQFRVESFNTFNHMNLQDINTQLGNRAFAQVSGVNSTRYFQAGIKLLW